MNRPLHEHSIAFMHATGGSNSFHPGADRNKDGPLGTESVCEGTLYHKNGVPRSRMEVYKLRDSLGPTIPADRRVHCSVFVFAWRSVLKTGNAEQDENWSFQCIQTYVLS
ncbi:hypothetical protein NPIL_484461 [Nephila pilipes]|uniref:Uncharacterized protein n=1 Tax=Nephila pilipes TaxID=299642 RepID=A0A8X6U9N0_NEPPI|nr:hypothetical protein NPIL_484461 [Nephila pilipes]